MVLENEKIESIITTHAISIFLKNQNVFLLDAVDLEDLKQEGRITAWQIIKKYETKNTDENFDIEKMVGMAVFNRLTDMLRGAIVHSKRYCQMLWAGILKVSGQPVIFRPLPVSSFHQELLQP